MLELEPEIKIEKKIESKPEPKPEPKVEPLPNISKSKPKAKEKEIVVVPYFTNTRVKSGHTKRNIYAHDSSTIAYRLIPRPDFSKK